MNRDPQTRASLILRLRDADDSRAWHEFAAIYEPVIYNVARKRGLQAADARDLIQEVLTRVAKSIESWQPDSNRGSFRGWLATITRNMVVDFFRKNKRLPRTADRSDVQALLANVPAASPATSEFDLQQDRQRFLWAAERVKDQVSSATWSAFQLTAIEGMPVAEAAVQVGISKGAIYIARSRVMARLKKVVEQSGFDSMFEKELS